MGMSEWANYSIADMGLVVTGSTPSTKAKRFWDGEVPFYSPADFDGSILCTKTEKTVTEEALSFCRPIPVNAIMFTCIASVGKIAISSKCGVTNQQINSIIPFPDAFDYRFIYYILSYHRSIFENYAPQTTIPIINKGDFQKFSFIVPKDINEQRKIADILSTVDDVIEKTEAAIDKYQAIKAGMMQDLFTRGIDTQTGKMRPTFEEAPELYKKSELGWIPKGWNATEFKDACLEFINGGTPSTKNASNWVGNIPWITGADFLESFEVGFIRRHINEDALRYSSSHLIREGNILLVTRTGVGKLAIAPFDVAISQDITGIILDPNQCCVEFFYYYLQVLVEDFKKMNQGTSINGIIRSDLEATLILKPSLVEQKQIAAVLKALDDNLKSEQSNLSKYRDLKKGLMADLLTGKVRIK
ncbi:MAG TPA: hypothetical protein DHW79_02490 [Candidatus Cloacimonas sp.]|nr:hypothetical protein [Candidatus Cloacimonas sp.]